jgi:hypothetical protein
MEEVFIFASVIVPIVTALVELLKKTFPIRKNFIPAISVVVGLIIGAAAYPFTDMELVLRLWAGGFSGLAGTGLFELVKPRQGVSK